MTQSPDLASGPGNQRLPPLVLRLWERRTAIGPFAAAGAISIVGGGVLASAIAAPAPTRHGVWAVAYLVLVLGIGQFVLGVGQAMLAASPPTRRMVSVTAALFNVANVAILLGIITDHLIVFDVGAVTLLVALVLFLHGVRSGLRHGWPLTAYRLFVAGLIMSIPIGLVVTTAGSP